MKDQSLVIVGEPPPPAFTRVSHTWRHNDPLSDFGASVELNLDLEHIDREKPTLVTILIKPNGNGTAIFETSAVVVTKD